MMRSSAVVLLLTLGLATVSARAQGPGLGGYGGAMSDVGSGMGMSGPVIPYAGRFGGFMPVRMGGGSLAFTARGASAPGSLRTSFNLAPMAGGMTSMSGGTPRSSDASGLSSFGPRVSGGLGLGGGMTGMSERVGTGVMPPSFASPFRPPTNLLGGATAGVGMSM